MARYEQIRLPDYKDKDDPRCPECHGRLCYVGMITELNTKNWKRPFDESNIMEYKLYQCGTCLGLFREIKEG